MRKLIEKLFGLTIMTQEERWLEAVKQEQLMDARCDADFRLVYRLGKEGR